MTPRDPMEREIFSAILKLQKNEITEYFIYEKLAKRTKDSHNKKILEKIAKDELNHHKFLESITKKNPNPNKTRIHLFIIISRLFGLSFGLKLMEKGEELAVDVYGKLADRFPDVIPIIQDEQKHEKELLDMLAEERLEYAGSLVLGLNDALVELTGALVGFTFALQNGKLVATIGFISGIAAAMSMAASGYLSSKEEAEQSEKKSPVKSALYTGIAYIITVALLILPYLLFANIYFALVTMLLTCIVIIAGYTFYITTAKSLRFWQRFPEMAMISLSVALISFGIGWAVRTLFGIEL